MSLLTTTVIKIKSLSLRRKELPQYLTKKNLNILPKKVATIRQNCGQSIMTHKSFYLPNMY